MNNIIIKGFGYDQRIILRGFGRQHNWVLSKIEIVDNLTSKIEYE